MIEIGSIRLALTCGGMKNLWVAAMTRKTVMIQILESETILPMTSALCQPKVLATSAPL